MKVNVNDVVTLEDNRKFLVLSETVKNNNRYFYIIEVNDQGQELVDHVKIVKEDIIDGEISLIPIKDHDEIDDVKEELVKKLDENDLA